MPYDIAAWLLLSCPMVLLPASVQVTMLSHLACHDIAEIMFLLATFGSLHVFKFR
jgi:hypothetical protein